MLWCCCSIIVCPAKYRRVVFSKEVGKKIKDICLEIAKKQEMHFLEISKDNDHVRYLVQSVPTYSATNIVRTVKGITARETFHRIPSVKEQLWGGEFSTDGHFVNTIGRKGTEDAIRQYVKEQGKEKEYKEIHVEQLKLF